MLTEPDMSNALDIILWELFKCLPDIIRRDREEIVTGSIICNKDRNFVKFRRRRKRMRPPDDSILPLRSEPATENIAELAVLLPRSELLTVHFTKIIKSRIC